MDPIKGYAFNKEILKTKTEYIYEAADINSKKKVIISILNIADLTASEKIILENQSEVFKERDEESVLKIIDTIKEPNSLTIITEYFSEGNLNNYIE